MAVEGVPGVQVMKRADKDPRDLRVPW
jgi:hypothetical protein